MLDIFLAGIGLFKRCTADGIFIAIIFEYTDAENFKAYLLHQ